LGNRAYGIAIDASDNVYVSNAIDGTIRKFSNAGQDLGVFASTGVNYATGLAFDPTGNLYAADDAGGTIEKFSSSGLDLGVFATLTTGSPFNLTFNSAGDLFVTNKVGGHSIREFSPTGQDLGDFATGLENPQGIVVLPTAVPAAVPEPGMLTMLTGTLLWGANLFVRRRRKSSSSP
jgi:WD40 repeat protein